MAEKEPMTVNGYASLKERLRVLKQEEMPRISREIGAAREMGDLSENAEYHAAKEKQGLINAQIMEIEDKLARAQVIDVTALAGERVVFGATVELEELDTSERMTYKIVGVDEADTAKGLISYQSPVAKALIGKEEGDEVKVTTPKGVRTLEIIGVHFKA